MSQNENLDEKLSIIDKEFLKSLPKDFRDAVRKIKDEEREMDYLIGENAKNNIGLSILKAGSCEEVLRRYK
jgi:hypothetical protein